MRGRCSSARLPLRKDASTCVTTDSHSVDTDTTTTTTTTHTINDPLEALRSAWQFTAVAQFFHLFCDSFGLDFFSTEQLEDNLIMVPVTKYIVDIHVNLLQRATTIRNIDHSNWYSVLSTQLQKCIEEGEDPLDGFFDQTDYSELPILVKVLILHRLCDWQFVNLDRFQPLENVVDEDEVHWRVEPIGFDAQGNTYYLFDDNRVYMEIAPPDLPRKRTRRKFEIESDSDDGINVDTKSKWVLVCRTVQDWESWPLAFKSSTHPDEKALYEYLTVDAMPHAISELKKWTQTQRMQEALQNRKRSTRLQIREIEQNTAAVLKSSSVVEPSRENHRDNVKPSRIRSGSNLVKHLEEESRRKEAERKAAEILRSNREKERERRIIERARRIKDGSPSFCLESSQLTHMLMDDSHKRRLSQTDSLGIMAMDFTADNDVKPDVISFAHDTGGVVDMSAPQTPLPGAIVVACNIAKATSTSLPCADTLCLGDPSSKTQPHSDASSSASMTAPNAPIEVSANETLDESSDVHLIKELIEEKWQFNCRCGLRGENIDDGTPMVECGVCGVWSHIACVARRKSRKLQLQGEPEEWESRDFHTFSSAPVTPSLKSPSIILSSNSLHIPPASSVSSSETDLALSRTTIPAPRSSQSRPNAMSVDRSGMRIKTHSSTVRRAASDNETHPASAPHSWMYARGLDAIVEAALHSDESAARPSFTATTTNTMCPPTLVYSWASSRPSGSDKEGEECDSYTTVTSTTRSYESSEITALAPPLDRNHLRVTSEDMPGVSGMLFLSGQTGYMDSTLREDPVLRPSLVVSGAHTASSYSGH
ncbi:hypothetical protein BASA61_003143 [Batrachochytrium salamandrivorans]|nr:hypothetical protein BASA61_003143 [Batrachochytrium salamandrivorans]